MTSGRGGELDAVVEPVELVGELVHAHHGPRRIGRHGTHAGILKHRFESVEHTRGYRTLFGHAQRVERAPFTFGAGNHGAGERKHTAAKMRDAAERVGAFKSTLKAQGERRRGRVTCAVPSHMIDHDGHERVGILHRIEVGRIRTQRTLTLSESEIGSHGAGAKNRLREPKGEKENKYFAHNTLINSQ